MPAAASRGASADDLFGRRFGVVGVDQQGEVLRPRAGEGLEGRGFVVIGLDEGMRHGAEGRDARHSARPATVAVPAKPAM